MRLFAPRVTVGFLLSIALVLAGCGSGSSHTATHRAVATVRFCSGLTDKCETVPASAVLLLQSARGRIPDVSSYQGHPNWAAAKAAGIAGGIFKGGENVIDPTAAYNAHALAALHLWHAMYWFVRNRGCSHVAAQIIAAAHAFGVTVVVNDLEVPEAAGYGACLVPRERAAHLIPVDYTAPGTFPGGGFGLAPLWQAEFGPILHPFWHPVVAWQCSDGVHGCVTYVPGIGLDDVSINLGITKLGAPTPPARIHCFGPHAQRRAAKCKRIRPLVARWTRARKATIHALTVHRCVRPYRRSVCRTLGQRRTWFNREIKVNLY